MADPFASVWKVLFEVHEADLIIMALRNLFFIEPEKFKVAIERIERETTIGPMLNPTAYLDGRRWKNADDCKKILGHMQAISEIIRRSK